MATRSYGCKYLQGFVAILYYTVFTLQRTVHFATTTTRTVITVRFFFDWYRTCMYVIGQCDYIRLIIYITTSGPTPQVASSAVHMSARANKERKKKEKKKKKKKEHRAGFELGSSCSQTVCLTTRPWEHEATGSGLT